jgi:hypothetical protein
LHSFNEGSAFQSSRLNLATASSMTAITDVVDRTLVGSWVSSRIF